MSRGSRGCIRAGSGARLSAQGWAHPQRLGSPGAAAAGQGCLQAPPQCCHLHHGRGYIGSHQPYPLALLWWGEHPQEMSHTMHPVGLASCAAGSCLSSWALTWCFSGGHSPLWLIQDGWMRPEDTVRVEMMGWGQQEI